MGKLFKNITDKERLIVLREALGKELDGACDWSITNKTKNRFTVMLKKIHVPKQTWKSFYELENRVHACLHEYNYSSYNRQLGVVGKLFILCVIPGKTLLKKMKQHHFQLKEMKE